MRRRFGLLGVLFVTAMLTAGCSGLSPAAFDVRAGFDPTSLGFEVGDDDITIVSNNVIFVSAPGSIGGVVTGYEIEFFDESGNLLLPDARPFRAENAIAHVVLPGLSCAGTVPCSLLESGVSPQRQVSEALSMVTLPAMYATAVLGTSSPTGYAVGVFYATSDNGQHEEIPFEVNVTYPVGD